VPLELLADESDIELRVRAKQVQSINEILFLGGSEVEPQ
jgi:hypothetical protein